MCIRDRTWRRRSRSSAEVRNETGTARIIDVVWSRSKQDTLVLPVSALALLILGDYKATSGWNWHNWMLESKSYGTAVDQQVQDALAEGWAWLTTHGLFMNSTSHRPVNYDDPSVAGEIVLLADLLLRLLDQAEARLQS